MEHTKSREVLWNALGTVNYVAAYYTESQQEAACKALSEAERYLTEMDDRLSVFKENSEISQINRCAGQCDTWVSEDTFTLLQLAKSYGTMTGGAFDITTLPLTHSRNGKAGGRVNYRDLLLHRRERRVRLRYAGQGIHLGGIAKGYAADRIAALLTAAGITQATIDLGGTVRHIGTPKSTGIRHPFDPDRVAAVLESADEAIVTSGLYERGSHIFDPTTGGPAVTDLASATVVGPNGAAADAAATACLVIGSRRSAALLKKMKLDGLLIRRDGGVFVTSALQSRLKLISGA